MLTTDTVPALSRHLGTAAADIEALISYVDREVLNQGRFTVEFDAIRVRSVLREILDGVLVARSLL